VFVQSKSPLVADCRATPIAGWKVPNVIGVAI
jgi:hypothetical protein